VARSARRNLSRNVGRIAKQVIKSTRDLNKKRREPGSYEEAQLRYSERETAHSLKLSKKLYSSAVSLCFQEMATELAAMQAPQHKLDAFRERGAQSLMTAVTKLYNKAFDNKTEDWEHYLSRAAKLISAKGDVDLPTAAQILNVIDYTAEVIGERAAQKATRTLKVSSGNL